MEELFKDQPRPMPCSWNECLAGHRWPPTLLIAACPGCGSPTVAFKQENCPFCNEPVKQTVMRSDFVVPGGGVAPRCKGAKPMGDSLDLELTRQAWQEAEANHLSFEAKKQPAGKAG